MPLVRRYLNRKAIWLSLLDTYGPLCVYCHSLPSMHIEHVIPYSYAGAHDLANLVPSCNRCNLIAGDKVFDGFDEKYEFIRSEIARRPSKKRRLFACLTCLLPYYSFLCPNALLCPVCYDREYSKHVARGRAWREWVNMLRDSDYDLDAHRMLGEEVDALRNTSLPLSEKLIILQKHSPTMSITRYEL